MIQKFEGGDIEGEITTIPVAHAHREKRDLVLRMGLSMGQPVKDWIDASLSTNPPRKSGEIQVADLHRKVQQVYEFEDALVTAIGFPALDASAKDAAPLSLKFSPWIVRNKKGDGSVLPAPGEATRKAFHPSSFRLTIDGLEGACAKVSKVDALEIRRALGVRDATLVEPGKLEFPNLKITLSEEYSHDFVQWHERSARGDASQKKRGRLVYLDQETGDELVVLELEGLGVTKISAAPRVNNEDKIASVTVEMYCEGITSKFA